jgi:cysteine-rich repeat protein
MTRRPLPRVLLGVLFALALLAASASSHAAGFNYVGRVGGLNGASALAISPDGASVIAAASALDDVTVFSRDAASGALTQVQKLATYSGAEGIWDVRSIAISADGTSVYMTTRKPIAPFTRGISVFSRDTGTGMLTLLEIQKNGVDGVSGLDNPFAIAVSSDGLNVYVREQSGLVTFARNTTTGALTFVGAETFATSVGAGSNGILLSPDGANLYTIDDKKVLMYARAPLTGVLSFLGAVENGVNGASGINVPRNLAVSPDGLSVYVCAVGDYHFSNDGFTVLARNPGTGLLTYVEKHHEPRPLRSINSAAVAPTGDRVYFTARFFTDAAAGFYARNTGTGALTLGDTVGQKDVYTDPNALQSPSAIVVSPDGAHVYVLDPGSNAIVIFDVRCGTGALDPGEGCDDGNNGSYDGCDSSCNVELCYACAGEPSVCVPDDGIACDDGTVCTVADTCNGGYCYGTPNDGVACNDGNVCTIDDTCLGGGCLGSAEPEAGCRTPVVPGGAALKIKVSDPDPPLSELQWKWAKGQATTVADFGDPVGGPTNYTACLYQPTTGFVPALWLNAPSGCSSSSCWKQSSRGFKFRSSAGPLRRVKLKAGPDGKASVEIAATNAIAGPDVMPLTPPVTVQLKAWSAAVPGAPTVDACWSATYTTPAQNDAKKFKARSD